MKKLRAGGTQDEAVAELRACAQGGHRDAQFELGALYKLGQGVGKNRVRALGWFLRATVQHDVDAAIQAGLLMDVLQPDQVWRAQRWAYDLREDER